MTSLSPALSASIVSRIVFSFQCYDLGARSWIVPSQVLTEGARMLRFLAPTDTSVSNGKDTLDAKIYLVHQAMDESEQRGFTPR
jgi:hypothetical protein